LKHLYHILIVTANVDVSVMPRPQQVRRDVGMLQVKGIFSFSFICPRSCHIELTHHSLPESESTVWSAVSSEGAGGGEGGNELGGVGENHTKPHKTTHTQAPLSLKTTISALMTWRCLIGELKLLSGFVGKKSNLFSQIFCRLWN
jgi:hypothetical protein